MELNLPLPFYSYHLTSKRGQTVDKKGHISYSVCLSNWGLDPCIESCIAVNTCNYCFLTKQHRTNKTLFCHLKQENIQGQGVRHPVQSL